MAEQSFASAANFSHSLTSHYVQTAEEANSAISPVSVFICMSMLKHGATGKTKTELEKSLSINSKNENQDAQHVIRKLTESSNDLFTLTTANGLFLQEGFEPETAFVDYLKSEFTAHVENAKFGSEEGEKIVNDWVKKETNGKIKDLIKDTTEDHVMALVNAVYMKGKWAKPFEKEDTDEGEFNLLSGEKVNVQLMKQIGSFAYVKSGKFVMAFLPYKSASSDTAWEMGILLPEQGLKPTDFLKFLQRDQLKGLRSKAKLERLDVILPKCRVESTIDLIPIFKKLGVKAAFTPGADFSGISANESTMVSSILQKCFVDIDEEGTEAAAATAVMMMLSCAVGGIDEPPITFHVTCPYVYFIYQPSTGIVLFNGVVTDPTGGH